LIAHWPKGITAAGELRRQTGHLIDIAATCVELAGAEYPKSIGTTAITPLEGKSLLPAFANQPLDREALFWEHEGNRAVRMGDWKLVSKHAQPWELYDVKKDRIEENNLAATMPERVKEMTSKYLAWAERAHVAPWPVNPAKKTNTGE
jgi:arylsulfatase